MAERDLVVVEISIGGFHGKSGEPLASWLQKMLDKSFIVIDFETTGLSPDRGDRITEVAALRVNGDGILDRYQSLVNCGVRVPQFITAYTGITQRMVDTAPSVNGVMRRLLEFVGRSPVVAHNASFDQRFFDSECALSGYKGAGQQFICSMRVARRIYPGFPSHALGALAERLKISFSSRAHRAGADAEVTAHLMLKIAQELKGLQQRTIVDERLLRKIMRMPVATAMERLRGSS